MGAGDALAEKRRPWHNAELISICGPQAEVTRIFAMNLAAAQKCAVGTYITCIMFLDALPTLAHATVATTNVLGGKNAIQTADPFGGRACRRICFCTARSPASGKAAGFPG